MLLLKEGGNFRHIIGIDLGFLQASREVMAGFHSIYRTNAPGRYDFLSFCDSRQAARPADKGQISYIGYMEMDQALTAMIADDRDDNFYFMMRTARHDPLPALTIKGLIDAQIPLAGSAMDIQQEIIRPFIGRNPDFQNSRR